MRPSTTPTLCPVSLAPSLWREDHGQREATWETAARQVCARDLSALGVDLESREASSRALRFSGGDDHISAA
jgi:hypothetical protein